jgi:hypothetical protein
LFYYKKDYGIFQFPCLFSIVSLAFVVPQLLRIFGFVYNPDLYMGLSLYVMISCSIATTIGFDIGCRIAVNPPIQRMFNRRKLQYVVLLFAIVGLGATFLNRGVYKGGFVSGTFVIINFFSSYLDYLLILILLCFYKGIKVSKLFYVVFFVIILVQIDKFLISARRSEAIQFVLTLSFFFFLFHSVRLYHQFKWIIPAFFFVGLLLNSQIGQYRMNAYSGKVSVADNMEMLHLSFGDKTTTLKDIEINNAILGINNIYRRGIYDYGTFNWNGLVKNFVPRIIGGAKFKQSMMFQSDESLVKRLSRSGSTMTGFYDAFSSFGIFCWAKFFVIGLFLGFLWHKSETSLLSLVLYVALLSSSLMTITHSTNSFFSSIVFFVIFIYPFLSVCLIRSNMLE